MSLFRMLLAEILHRKINFALSLFAVTVAVMLFTAGPVLVDGYGQDTRDELAQLEADVVEAEVGLQEAEKAQDEEMKDLQDNTRKTMLGLGFNLMIVHRNTDMLQYTRTGLPTNDMEREYVERLARDPDLEMVAHLVATLRDSIEWEERQVLLIGYLPETTQEFRRHMKPMGYTLKQGTVFLGFHLTEGREVGETIEVRGQPFRVARLLPETGNPEDIAIIMHLEDAQALLERPGAINQILALECNCGEESLEAIRLQIASIVPEASVVRDQSRANARKHQRGAVEEHHQKIIEQRKETVQQRQETLAQTAASREGIGQTTETLAFVVTGLVVLVSAVWVGLLALINVRERRTEIGVLRAIGKGPLAIAALFLGKAVLLGIMGAGVGFVLGTGLAYWLGMTLLAISPEYLRVSLSLLAGSLIGAPVLAAVASYLPTVIALTQDPAVVLREH
ncbi:MAG: hypothetical protein HQ581_18145 [Planctomycetes bacterium]|nr:hypothetical protein [Planctomycetota bacterium]